MRLKRSIISLLVCLAMCFSFLPMTVLAAGETPITSIIVTGVQTPVCGEPCSTSDIVVNIPEDSGWISVFWLKLVNDGERGGFWSGGREWKELDETDTFEAGVYKLFVGVAAKSGYVINYERDSEGYLVYTGETKFVYTDNTEEIVSARIGDYGCSFSTKMFPIGGASIPTGVWVNGEQFTEDKLTIECGSGTATLDITTSPYKLTLNNAEITKAHTGQIESSYQALNIELIGSNSLTSSSMAIYMRYVNVTFTGTGNLTTSGGDMYYGSIYVGDLVFANEGDISINYSPSYIPYGPCIFCTNVTFAGSGNVSVVSSKSSAIECRDNVVFTGSGDVSLSGYGSSAGEPCVIDFSFPSTDKIYLNGTNSMISFEANGTSTIVTDGVVEGTNLDKYDLEGAIDSNSAVYTLRGPAVYDVWVNGNRFSEENLTIACGNGTASYDPATNVLTLDGAQITNASHAGGAIQSSGDLTVNVIGDSSITLNSYTNSHGIFAVGDLVITGTKNLDICVNHEDSDGIEAYGSVTISGSGNVSILSACYGIWTDHSSVILTGSGELNIMSRYVGVMLWGDDSKLFLNGTNSRVSIEVGDDEKTVFNGDAAVSSVVGTSIDEYNVSGSPDSSRVVYTLKSADPETGIAGFCERLYTCCLGRASEPAGKAYWIESLKNGATGADAAHAFFFCPEFIDGGFSNEEYVTRLYTTFMDRVPSDVELSYWADLITSGAMTRESVFWGFVGSPEWIGICESYGILPGTVPAEPDPVDPIEAFATRLYTTCLGRSGEEAGIAYWADALRSGNATGRAAAHTFFFSDEFIGGGHTNAEFVQRLYRTFMGRDGSIDEIAYWTSNVNTYGREAVFDGFATSDEFADLCNAAGINP